MQKILYATGRLGRIGVREARLVLKCENLDSRGKLMEAYCMKCRERREVTNPQAVTMKNGRPATSGTCSVCSTKVFKIGKAE